MSIKVAIAGLIIGALIWRTDIFQRVAFPVNYWTAKVNRIDADIAFTKTLIAAPDTSPDEAAMWQELIDYDRQDRATAMEKLVKARSY